MDQNDLTATRLDIFVGLRLANNRLNTPTGESDTSKSEYGATDSDNDSHQITQMLNRIQYSRRNHTKHITKVHQIKKTECGGFQKNKL